MTCYFRGLKEVFKKAGIEVTKDNRKDVDKLIRRTVGVENGNCPEVWKEVKKCITEDEQNFVSRLKTAWKTQA